MPSRAFKVGDAVRVRPEYRKQWGGDFGDHLYYIVDTYDSKEGQWFLSRDPGGARHAHGPYMEDHELVRDVFMEAARKVIERQRRGKKKKS